MEIEEQRETEIQQARTVLEEDGDLSATLENRPLGWKVMPFILGNETLQRLATFGLLPSLNLYLLKQYHMDQVSAAFLLSMWGGTTGLAPLVGAFIADAYIGRFKTIVVGLFFSFTGLLVLSLGAWVPNLHPEKCILPAHECAKPTGIHWGIFFTGLGLLTAGTAAVMPCNVPFGIDQFDNTENRVKGIASFVNWYYASFTSITIIALTLVAYILSKNWAIGFTILTASMLCAFATFLSGRRLYVLKRPEGSIYTRIIRVLVAYYKKRKLELPGVYYDPPSALSKIKLTNRFRFLNKAAMIQENDLNSDGSRKNLWGLSTVRDVEDVKCLMKVTPILLSGVISFTSLGLQSGFLMEQVLAMDLNIGRYSVPASSLPVISLLVACIWIPFYDRIVVQKLKRYTKHNDGITTLQRMGIGMVFSVLSMIVAAIVEKERRSAAQRHAPQMSVFWLAPQLILVGLSESFVNIGQLEFYNKELPQHMGGIAGALFPCAMAVSHQLIAVIIKLVKLFTESEHHAGWLAGDPNIARLDYLFYFSAVLGAVNLIYHIYAASRYHYDVATTAVEENSFELTSTDV